MKSLGWYPSLRWKQVKSDKTLPDLDDEGNINYYQDNHQPFHPNSDQDSHSSHWFATKRKSGKQRSTKATKVIGRTEQNIRAKTERDRRNRKMKPRGDPKRTIERRQKSDPQVGGELVENKIPTVDFYSPTTKPKSELNAVIKELKKLKMPHSKYKYCPASCTCACSLNWNGQWTCQPILIFESVLFDIKLHLNIQYKKVCKTCCSQMLSIHSLRLFIFVCSRANWLEKYKNNKLQCSGQLSTAFCGRQT